MYNFLLIRHVLIQNDTENLTEFPLVISALNDEGCMNRTKASLIMKYNSQPLQLTPGCKLKCSKVFTDVATCLVTKGDRTLLNVVYFLFR